MKTIMTLFIFCASWPLFADSCQCPVVQCDPCQRPLRLGTEELSCGLLGKMECDKVVCENVDNFFQCLAGEPALYIPRQNPMTRITEPKDPAEKIHHPIDFQKLAEHVQTEVVNEEVLMQPKEKPVAPKAALRSPTAVESKQTPVLFEVSKKTGAVQVNGSALKKNTTKPSNVFLQTKNRSEIVVKGSWGELRLKLSAATELAIDGSEDVIRLDLKKGDLVATLLNMKTLVASDLGEWRFAKRRGVLGLSRSGGILTLLNEEEEGLLRRNELIAVTQKVGPQKIFQFTSEEGLVASRDAQGSASARPQDLMPTPLIPVAEARAVASDSLCISPEAPFQSCAWKCFGAGAKDKKCESSKNSKCVRFTCAADGTWKLPTMASSSECSVDVVRVGACQ